VNSLDRQANARLIATAPELLAALQPFADLEREVLAFTDSDLGGMYAQLAAAAREAIAKATGGKP
jgi:hypothetical protein